MGNEGGRAEEEIQGEGGGVIVRMMEAEAVRGRDTLEPGGRTEGDGAIQETDTGDGGDGGRKQGEEVSQREGSSGSRNGMW